MAEFLMPSFPRRRESRFLNVSRALRAISKAICGWLRPCTMGDFLLLVQEKVTKEKDTPKPPTPAGLPCASRENRRSPNSPGAKYAPRAQTRGSLLPIPAAMLGGGYGDPKTPTVPRFFS